MKSKYIWVGTFILVIFVIGVMASLKIKKIDKQSLNSLEGTVLSYNQDNLIIQDTSNAIYTFKMENKDISVGEHIILEYMGGVLKKKKILQNIFQVLSTS